MAVSDAPGCVITYDHFDNSRCVIYDHNILRQATGVTNVSFYEYWVSLVRVNVNKSNKYRILLSMVHISLR